MYERFAIHYCSVKHLARYISLSRRDALLNPVGHKLLFLRPDLQIKCAFYLLLKGLTVVYSDNLKIYLCFGRVHSFAWFKVHSFRAQFTIFQLDRDIELVTIVSRKSHNSSITLGEQSYINWFFCPACRSSMLFQWHIAEDSQDVFTKLTWRLFDQRGSA